MKLLSFVATTLIAATAMAAPIDRHALVMRHNPTVTTIDRAAPLMVGNGNLAFTADITGLQTFPEQYSPLVPLLIESQWGWHSFPNPGGVTLDAAQVDVGVPGVRGKYPYLRNWDEAKNPAIQWLRENPHKFSLGRVGLALTNGAGKPAAFADLSASKQTLDLWSGRLSSSFTFDGEPVEVETSMHPVRDVLIVRVKSRLVFDGRLGVDLAFPGVNKAINPDPADWSNPDAHVTNEISRGAGGLELTRQIDDTTYAVRVASDRELDIATPARHRYRLTAPGATQMTLLIEFSPRVDPEKLPDAETARATVARWWNDYWTRGAMVELKDSKDPRADELERRIVLSQYLTAVNSAGVYPPQEEGLFSNSWNGKFHLEMHAWHSGHFASWGRPDLLERSMSWYVAQLPNAQARARSHKLRGAWWPKMVGPEGRESPSTVNPFIMWQQPHPIYLAESLWLDTRDPKTLDTYKGVVFGTADLLASWATYDRKTKRFRLGPPIIPAQETHAPLTTFNPTFELEYWRFGLKTAQAWRERLGLKRDPKWDDVLKKLSPLPQKDGLYLAAESQPDLWEKTRTPACSKKAGPDCPNRDHPSFVAALGLLPGEDVDHETMRRTLDAVISDWDLRQTWGWDWPMLAMTAWRLGERDRAFDFLLSEAKNFQFGASGMTPRLHIADDAAPHAAGTEDTPGYRRVAETYFPSNGALLLAVALMANNPGEPGDGRWVIHAEGFRPVP
ncbi:MAG TPA: hypothetical protein VMF52_03550 [Steroidobacteraceae bacterium]|nr:hypothetical protein [Steroidobacteraceae bacterium]